MIPNYELCPEITKETIDLYVSHGSDPGSFVQAVLENDLIGSFEQADEKNITNMPHIAAYVYNCIPRSCWGSPEIVREWRKSRRFQYE